MSDTRPIYRAAQAIPAVGCEQCGASVNEPCLDMKSRVPLPMNKAHVGRMSAFVRYMTQHAAEDRHGEETPTEAASD